MTWIVLEKRQKLSVLILMRKFLFVNYFSWCLPVPATPLPSYIEEDADCLYYVLTAASALLISTGDCSLACQNR